MTTPTAGNPDNTVKATAEANAVTNGQPMYFGDGQKLKAKEIPATLYSKPHEFKGANDRF